MLLATRAAFDGASVGDVAAVLDETRRRRACSAASTRPGLAGARRWFTLVRLLLRADPLDDLIALGLLEDA